MKGVGRRILDPGRRNPRERHLDRGLTVPATINNHESVSKYATVMDQGMLVTVGYWGLADMVSTVRQPSATS